MHRLPPGITHGRYSRSPRPISRLGAADGYSGFEDLHRSCAIREAVCNARVRRKLINIHRSEKGHIIVKAVKQGPSNTKREQLVQRRSEVDES